MIGRYAFSVVLGVVVTLSLLFVMQLLIVTGKQALTDPRDRHKLEFVRVKKDESVNTADLAPEKPPKPPETPPETPPQDMDNIDPDAPSIDIPAPTISADTDIGGPGGHEYRRGRLFADRAGCSGLSRRGHCRAGLKVSWICLYSDRDRNRQRSHRPSVDK